MSTYAAANRAAQWYADKYGSAKLTPNCVVWHSTETFGWPGYSGGSMAPNYTVLPDIANKRLLWRAHFEDQQSSRALVNAPGGVDTNTANAIQVEIIGTCNPAWAKTWPGTSKVGGRDYLYLPDAPDWFLAGLADFARDMNRRHGIPLTSGLTWLNYGPDPRRKDGKSPASYGLDNGVRMTFAQWRAFVGHCGHQHVPENDHGDPGALPMGRILSLAAGATRPNLTPAPTPAAQEDDMPYSPDQIYAVVWKSDKFPAPVLGTNGGDTWTPENVVKILYQMVDQRTSALTAQVAALTAVVQSLAGAQGADPTQIAGIVDKAVRDRLAQVKFDVTDAPA